MLFSVPRLIAAGLSAVTTALACYFFWQGWSMMSHSPDDEAALSPSAVMADEARRIASQNSHVIVAFDEIQVNVEAPPTGDTRLLSLKVEIELFAPDGRGLLETRQAGVKNTIIESVRQETTGRLGTTPGKLAFKEHLVARINTFFNQPVVRDIHFASFVLQ